MSLSLSIHSSLRCGALHVGDRLLSVNGVILENRTAREVVQMLLHSNLHVKLEIVPSHNFPDVPDTTPEEGITHTHTHAHAHTHTHTHTHTITFLCHFIIGNIKTHIAMSV